MAFVGAGSPADHRAIDAILEHLAESHIGVAGFAAAWARHQGLDWAADLLSQGATL